MLANIRISLEAEELWKELDEESKKKVLSKIKQPKLIKREELKKLLDELKEEEKIKALKKKLTIEVRKTYFQPIAKEYESNIKIDRKREAKQNINIEGIESFIKHFQNRFRRIKMFFNEPSTLTIEEALKERGEVKVIGMVESISKGKEKNFVIEDLTGKIYVKLSENPTIEEEFQNITPDDVVLVEGKIRGKTLIASAISFPDIQPPLFPTTEKDIAIAYLSDIHVGSKYFLEKTFEKFVRWLKGKEGNTKTAEKIKYIVIAGDLVDGVGIYPKQEEELIIKDLEKQYKTLCEWLSLIPDYIDIILTPGNHDGVRRSEPTPPLPKDLIHIDAHLAGNPARVYIEELKHLIYHGTSMDSLISQIPWASYKEPEKVMIQYLKKRHLSPIYGENPIFPDEIDLLVIDETPHILHMGHVHKNGYSLYKNVAIINSGTFQDQTPYQLKQGHIPSPGEVPIYEIKTKKIKSILFKTT